MSSQDPAYPSFPFTISTPFRPVRLLEVPDDLLSVITNTDTSSGSTGQTLKFKSAPAATSSSTTRISAAKEGILHLCTEDKSWAVKQVSTSNSVYLIRPSEEPNLDRKRDGDEDDEMQDADGVTHPSSKSSIPTISAVSQASSFLELHPVKSDIATVEAAIIDLVPVYHTDSSLDGEDIDLDLMSSNNSKPSMTLAEVIDSIPAPDSLVRKALARLTAFESSGPLEHETVDSIAQDENLGGKRRCMIPSTDALLTTWRNVIESCTIENIRLDLPIDPRTINNALSGTIDQAIAERLFHPEATLSSLGISDTTPSTTTTTSTTTATNHVTLNPQKTSRFTAALLLTATSTSTQQSNLSTFLTQWTDLVPSRFMKSCTVETLRRLPGVTITGPEPGSGSGSGLEVDTNLNIVKWAPTTKHATTTVAGVTFTPALETFIEDRNNDVGDVGSGNLGGGTGGTGGVAAEPRSTMVDKKRKWHEKFGAQRDRDREREGRK